MEVEYEKKGKIAVITINRPQAMNSLSMEVHQGLRDSVSDLFHDPELYVGIITGAGEKAFCAGADLKGWQKRIDEEAPTGPPQDMSLVTGFLMREDDDLKMWKPLIAAITGYCLGGGLELALGCDIRIAAEHARFAMPEVTIGRIPGFKGVQRLSWLLHSCHAAEILMTGQQIDAQEAYRMGLVNRVVPMDKLMPTAMEWAETISQAAPQAVRSVKQLMVRGHGMVMKEGMELEGVLGSKLLQSEDFREGIMSFAEKRKPKWKAR